MRKNNSKFLVSAIALLLTIIFSTHSHALEFQGKLIGLHLKIKRIFPIYKDTCFCTMLQGDSQLCFVYL